MYKRQNLSRLSSSAEHDTEFALDDDFLDELEVDDEQVDVARTSRADQSLVYNESPKPPRESAPPYRVS